ncbi:trehalose-phosphatase [Corynebacterium sp. YSMAA1_1_F7]|uniref:trehalose-phosphatase n=1 Tax=Corynebacterium sp. YSMAA1_1_F7 TaxID=3383590 RepID=UPI0038D1E315
MDGSLLPILSDADLSDLATTPDLLVAMDFDGTLAHFSDAPAGVHAVPGAMEALVSLSQLPHTVAMVISGRNLELLTNATMLPVHGPVRLVGSHGAEPAQGGVAQLSPQQRAWLGELRAHAEEIATAHEGAWVEAKPLAVGLHTRLVPEKELAGQLNQRLADFAATSDLSQVTWGKDILEVAVDKTTKGSYIADYRRAYAREHGRELRVLFAGDDTTDETVLSTLRYSPAAGSPAAASPTADSAGVDDNAPAAAPGSDIGIRVGGGETSAIRRLDTPEDVRDVLQDLLRRRDGRSADELSF